MNISRAQLDGIMRAYLKSSEHSKAKLDKKAPTYTDEVNLSAEVREIAHAIKLASQVEDIRTEKVEELKAKIKAGTYNIDGKLVADKIVEEIFADKLI
ncbi:flagellar biosynthesis anti-sigma factor FlgM [Tepidanaerobacter sp. GT38]|uniref:flagellar biosynthesis anti-sigma factor FlgM n=1 Tax=Tepidanaerobacter sp. GT38 TaxID=2722793 RepID=UPI001F010A50|nr:flagellar biosynthesis anti-sigma factor FlgM [Tepidanaerobacter sp. GT38]MCG1011205.1 flagellar biosynthesis anti-sigma factor FlgM [Tepidanaerobacter sp. GT38]